jgi:hypothetical protein
MAAITTTFGTTAAIKGLTVLTGSAAAHRSLRSLAALVLLIALFIVMVPGLSRVPATSGVLGSLQAPPTRIASEATTSVQQTADPTPQPGFSADR